MVIVVICKQCHKQYNQNNKEKITKRAKQYNEQYQQNNREKITEYRKQYQQNNREKINEYRRQYRSNPINRLINLTRNRINQALNNEQKADHSIELLGCSPEFFWKWISFQLPYEMSNEEFNAKYHLDHVRSINSFDKTQCDWQYDAFNWQNVQPLLAQKNLSKGDTRMPWIEVMQEVKLHKFLTEIHGLSCVTDSIYL